MRRSTRGATTWWARRGRSRREMPGLRRLGLRRRRLRTPDPWSVAPPHRPIVACDGSASRRRWRDAPVHVGCLRNILRSRSHNQAITQTKIPVINDNTNYTDKKDNPQITRRSRWPYPDKRDEVRADASVGQRSRHRTTGASAGSQSSKQVFQHREAGRRHRPRRRRILALRAESDRTLREAPYRLSPPWPLRLFPCFSVLKNLLACLPWIGRREPLPACLDWPTQRCAHLARHCAGSGRGGSASESVRYRHPGGNSSRAAVIRGFSSYK
jgi:hypothetical protein